MAKDIKRKEEKDLIEAINSSKLGTVRKILGQKIEVDCLDHTGMTPLQHACYKGDVEICRLLINHGANVNDKRHHHGYTALMFAALSGKKEVVRLMLENGADSSMVNSVKRTASQMASFVGKHEVASIINNHLDFQQLSKYSSIKGKDNKPMLPPQMVTSLHQYTLTSNFNPLHLAFLLREQRELLQNSGAVCVVLGEMVEGLMKRKETDEVAAIKLHYLSSYLQQIVSYMGQEPKNGGIVDGKGDAGKTEEIDFNGSINKWLKFLMKMNTPLDDPPPNQELVVRRAILSFPFHQSQLFQQILSTVSLYGDNDNNKKKTKKNTGIGVMSAMKCLFDAINGQRIKHEDEDKQCASCEEFDGKCCNACRGVYYCNRECQKLHWSVHKTLCAQMKERTEKMDRLRREEEDKRIQKVKEEDDKLGNTDDHEQEDTVLERERGNENEKDRDNLRDVIKNGSGDLTDKANDENLYDKANKNEEKDITEKFDGIEVRDETDVHITINDIK